MKSAEQIEEFKSKAKTLNLKDVRKITAAYKRAKNNIIKYSIAVAEYSLHCKLNHIDADKSILERLENNRALSLERLAVLKPYIAIIHNRVMELNKKNNRKYLAIS